MQRWPRKRRYPVPRTITSALQQIFADSAAPEPRVEDVAVVYRPVYVRAHLIFIGAWDGSVTRPGHIFTSLSRDVFFGLDRHLLHEYYHVVQQWGRERMTIGRYLANWRQREAEARQFARVHVAEYRELLNRAGVGPNGDGGGRSDLSDD